MSMKEFMIICSCGVLFSALLNTLTNVLDRDPRQVGINGCDVLFRHLPERRALKLAREIECSDLAGHRLRVDVRVVLRSRVGVRVVCGRARLDVKHVEDERASNIIEVRTRG